MSQPSGRPWIAVDLDGTLAQYEKWVAPDNIGAPIPTMVNRVRALLADKQDVRIFTARGSIDAEDQAKAYPAIRAWCLQHIGQELPITNAKDVHCIAIWDDRARGVVKNVGTFTDEALTFAALRAVNEARCLRWHPNGIQSWSASDWMVAVTGEVGELASLIKMLNRTRDNLVGNKFVPTKQHLSDEMADIIIYLDLLATVYGIDLATAVAHKFNVVSDRNNFPESLPFQSA